MLRINLSFPCQLKQAVPRKGPLWESDGDPYAFVLEAQMDGGSWTVIAPLILGNVRRYEQWALVEGHTYCYRMSARDEAGQMAK
jgi:hypothetical protein